MTDPITPDPMHTDAARTEAFRQDAERRATALSDREAILAGRDTEAEASRFATHGDPTLTNTAADTEAAARGGVQWVRPTDLAARAGGAVVDQGAKWNTALHDAALDGIRESRARLQERLAARQEALEPAATSGRAMQPVTEREGVSR